MNTATGNPAPKPANGAQTIRASAQASTLLRSAPIAMRTPTARFSSRTVQDPGENTPIPAKTGATAAIVPDTVVKARSFACAYSARMRSVVIPTGNSAAKASIRFRNRRDDAASWTLGSDNERQVPIHPNPTSLRAGNVDGRDIGGAFGQSRSPHPRESLTALAHRLKGRAIEAQQIAFGHQGPADGPEPLLDWASAVGHNGKDREPSGRIWPLGNVGTISAERNRQRPSGCPSPMRQPLLSVSAGSGRLVFSSSLLVRGVHAVD